MTQEELERILRDYARAMAIVQWAVTDPNAPAILEAHTKLIQERIRAAFREVK